MKKLSLKQSPEIKNTILAAIIVTVVVIFFYFFKFEGNITGFFRIGSTLALSPYLDSQDALIYQGEDGYDGQMFLSLALDPFLQNPGTIEALDNPVYRYRRILYPLLGNLLSFGNTQLIPYILVGINCLAIILIVFITSLYLKKYNGMTWQSLLVLCIPGVWIVLSFSTADLLSSLLFVSAIYLYRQDKPLYAAISIAAACLTRETMLLMWLAILLTSIWERKWVQGRYLLLAWVPAAIWNLYVLFRLHSQGASGTRDNFGYPLLGVIQKLISLVDGGLEKNNIFEAYLFILLIAIFLVTIWISIRFIKFNKLILISTGLYGIIFVMRNVTKFTYYLGYCRIYMDVYFLLLFSIAPRHINKFKIIPFAGAGLASLAFILLHK